MVAFKATPVLLLPGQLCSAWPLIGDEISPRTQPDPPQPEPKAQTHPNEGLYRRAGAARGPAGHPQPHTPVPIPHPGSKESTFPSERPTLSSAQRGSSVGGWQWELAALKPNLVPLTRPPITLRQHRSLWG